MIFLIKKIKKSLLNKYIDKMTFPQFSDGELVRKKIIFTGKVQRVGFRYQFQLLADKIKITGYARNHGKNSVITEVQGTKEQIDELLNMIKNEKRFIIKDISIEQLDVKIDENEFNIL